MILVTGATGHFGKATTDSLLEKGIAALVSSSDVKNDRLTQHKNVINAAIENGVQHIAYTGMDIKNFETTAIPLVMQVHIDTPNYLKGTGIPYTFLNNNIYADLLPMFLGKNPWKRGSFSLQAMAKHLLQQGQTWQRQQRLY